MEVIPHKMEIEACSINVMTFMDAVVSAVFGLEFEKVSMIDLIQNNRVKKRLEDATNHMNRNEISEALVTIAIAFEELLSDYEENLQQLYRNSHSNFGIQDYTRSGEYYNLEDDQKELVDTIISLQSPIKIIALGIDYQKYIRFKLIAPSIYADQDGWSPSIYQTTIDMSKNHRPKMNECLYCFNFVIEIAIRLQELKSQMRLRVSV